MPKPVRSVRRIVARYALTKINSLWWGKAYDVSGNRFLEADIKSSDKDLLQMQELCRDRVNDSFSIEFSSDNR
jgi:hypothetical protein